MGERKRKSFADFYGDDAKKIKLNDGSKLRLSNIKELLTKPLSQQKMEDLILLFVNPEIFASITLNDKRPLNFGLYDSNGITMETITWNKSDKLRILSLLKGCDAYASAIIIKNWCWKLNKSTYKHKYQIHNKIWLDGSSIKFIAKSDLESCQVSSFILCNSVERLSGDRNALILETCWLTVAKAPSYFFSDFHGSVVSDGKNFGVVAIKLDDDTNQLCEFNFDVDTVFKLYKSEATMMDIVHYSMPNDVKEHFMFENINSVPVFYIESETTIEKGDENDDVDFGERELSDIKYPSQCDDCFPLSVLFQKLKID